MAFPTINGSSSGNSGANQTTYNVTLPSGIVAGEMLIVLIAVDASAVATSWTSGWTIVDSLINGSNVYVASFVKTSASGSDTLSITAGASEGWAHTAYRIGNHGGTVEISLSATGSSTAPNSASLTPSWGSADTLWISQHGWDGNAAYSAYPANYSLNQVTNRWAQTGGTGVAMAARELNVATEDTGAGTLASSRPWGAYTLAVKPFISTGRRRVLIV